MYFWYNLQYFSFDLHKFISKNCKYILLFPYQKCVHLDKDIRLLDKNSFFVYTGKIHASKSIERYIPLTQLKNCTRFSDSSAAITFSVKLHLFVNSIWSYHTREW